MSCYVVNVFLNVFDVICVRVFRGIVGLRPLAVFILGVVGIGPCEEHGWHAAAPHLLFSPRAKLAYGRSCSF